MKAILIALLLMNTACTTVSLSRPDARKATGLWVSCETPEFWNREVGSHWHDTVIHQHGTCDEV